MIKNYLTITMFLSVCLFSSAVLADEDKLGQQGGDTVKSDTTGSAGSSTRDDKCCKN